MVLPSTAALSNACHVSQTNPHVETTQADSHNARGDHSNFLIFFTTFNSLISHLKMTTPEGGGALHCNIIFWK